jgi:hypothetical protein
MKHVKFGYRQKKAYKFPPPSDGFLIEFLFDREVEAIISSEALGSL